MAKKIVRGITDVKTINNQDFDTNNVNDLLSDGQYNYIHRKKGKNEEYHNLTDNIKTISSDNTELLSVTNNNKTTNTATLHPKHDKQKEQVLESTRDTITIHHGENGTDEKTTVDTNPQKVLEHSNLTVDYGLSKSSSGNTTKLGLEYTRVQDGYDLNNLLNGCVRAGDFLNAPQKNTWYFVSAFSEDKYTIQQAITLVDNQNTVFVRTKQGYTASWSPWREQVGDKSVIDDLLAQKQNTLISDSEYITLNHQQGENTTHIQTAALEQLLEVLSETISSMGRDTSSSIEYSHSDANYQLFKYVVTNGYHTFVTYTFNVNSGTPQLTFVGDFKNDLERFVGVDSTVSNGALKLTNDGTAIILINSKSTESGSQQGTFTFYERTESGGEGGGY